MDGVLVVTRLLLAGVLAAAAAAKVRNPAETARAARALGVPAGAAPPLGVLLPALEAAIAVGLVPGATATVAAGVAIVVLAMFTAAIASNLARGRRPACNCFGQASSEPIGGSTLVRNLALVGAAVFVFVAGPGPGVVRFFERGLPESGEVLAAAVVAQAAVIVWLVGRQRALLRRLDAVEAKAPATAGLAVGSPAPTFSVRDTRGNERTLADIARPERPTLLVFTDPACAPCQALYPELADWQSSYADLLTVAIISTGDPLSNAARARETGVATIFTDDGAGVGSLFAYEGTPGAVLVDTAHRVARPLATGGAAIRQLVSEVVAARKAENLPPPGTLSPGDPAPALRLPSLDGTPVDLYDLSGRPILVVFFSPTCSFCRELLGDLLAREDTLADAGVRLLVVTNGTRAENRVLGFSSTVVIDDDGLTSRAFGAVGTPAAVLVDATVKVGSELVSGVDEVLDLADRAVVLARAADALRPVDRE